MLGQLRLKYRKCNIVEYLDGCPSRIMDMKFIETNKVDLQEVYDLLSDGESKKVMENYILARLSGDIKPLSDLNSRKYLYDYELLELQSKDVVVDTGAFDGDTIREMEQFVKGRLSHIYAFEPDYATFEVLEKYTEDDNGNIDCINAGLWRKNDILNFGSNGTMTSKFDDSEKDSMIKVYSLDQFFQNRENQEVSIIKMDIEGAELDALAGAEKMIASAMPKLAICIYHKNEDIFSIPLFIKKITEITILRNTGFISDSIAILLQRQFVMQYQKT